MFFEKITNAERVLITVLYQRQVCTRKVLAELFEITPTTIGIACRRVGPLLDQDGYTQHQPRRYTQRPPPFSTP